MSVSAVSNAPVSLGFKPQPAHHIEAQRSDRNELSEAKRHQHHEQRGHGHAVQTRALNVFSQELRVAFEASFRARFAFTQSGYAQVQAEPSADDLARDALGAARQVVSEAPTDSSRALIKFRSKVHETASYVRETLGAQNDIHEVDDALARVDEGIDELESVVAKNQASTATALEVDVRSKQRTTIKIRTQEGDIVKLNLRRSERLSANDTSTTVGGQTSSSTDVEVSSRSRLSFSVDGDLNDDELAAIKNVFAQAETIATQFFGGDIAAAFDLAAGFEFNAEQLARVNLNFRSFQSSAVSYTETSRTPQPTLPTEPAPAAISARPPSTDGVVRTSQSVAQPSVDRPIASAPPHETQQSRPEVGASDARVEVPPSPQASPPLVDLSAFTELFEALSDFLRSVGSGFEGASETSSSSFRYHYSESFKLSLLLAVVHEVAPDESADTTSVVSAVIDAIASGSESSRVDQDSDTV